MLVNRHSEPFLFLYVESTDKGFRDYLVALEYKERREGSLPPADQEMRTEMEQKRRGVSPLLDGALGIPRESDRFAWWQKGKKMGKRRYWNDISVLERMQEAGLGNLYDTDYRLISAAVHATASVQGEYLEAGPPLTVSFGPKWNWVDTVLPKACHYLLLHLLVLDATFEMNMASCIKAQSESLKLLDEGSQKQ